MPSMAVDVMPYFKDSPHIRWDDTESVIVFSKTVKSIAQRLGINIRWGGDFTSFKDYPHWELV